MNNAEFARERIITILAVAGTLPVIPILFVLYFVGPEICLLISSLAFLVAYIFERVRLFRIIARLHKQRADGPPTPAPKT